MNILLVTIFLLLGSRVLLAQEVQNLNYKMPYSECYDITLYMSGEECYLKHNRPEYSNEGWKFLDVPVDYHSPNYQKTKISFRTNPDFSTSKKTIIFFNGGPGDTSHDTKFTALNDVNTIYFNQRGAAFSRPETNELFLNQNYYSSENTARDALEIVKYLGLKKVTSFGHSYGTVPATIFGSLFSDYTENVILEGVIYSGTSDLWKAEHRIKLVQKYFDKLDDTLKQNILKYSRHPDIFAGWFSKMAQQIMYHANFQSKLTDELNKVFSDDRNLPPDQKEKTIVDRLKFYSFRNIGEGNDQIFFSPTMFNFISCKELEASDDYSSFYAVFNEDSKLIPYRKSADIINFCQKHNIKKSKTYLATDYPLLVPVYYFQGTTDGATTVENAIWHYKRVARGRASLILSKNHGHFAAIQNLFGSLDAKQVYENDANYAIRKAVVKLFKSAVNNEDIELGELNNIINDKIKSWVKTQK